MNGSSYVHQDGAIPPAGLTVLFDPPKPSVDIVFIHGFTGHPEKTWTHKRGDVRHRNEDKNDDELFEPPSKVRRLNPFLKSHHGGNSNTAVCWPRDLVPETIPYARVLTYGYDTHLRHCFGPPVSRNTVYDIAWDFLVALEAERRLEPSRPVLFIAHSLGGIIVKEMLRRSSGCHIIQTHLRGVFDSTIGIIFFGTPHGGADPRGFLQHIAEAVIKAAGVRVNEQIVNTLLPSAERLRELRDEFGPMAHQQDWMIHSFQEELGIMGLNGHKVVEDLSSYLNIPSIEISQHIGQNHMHMCRFAGLNDVEYKKVAAALHRMTRMVSKQSKGAEVPSLSEEQRQTLVDSMRFDQIDARQMTIKRAHAKTCEWLLKKSEYLDWLDATKLHEHHGFLWIKGKPGTGKSTVMKFALNNSRKTMKDRIIISFFFNARGADLERTTIGMYRSLLVQLLERLPELQSVFQYLGFTWINSGHYEWSVELLNDLFGQAIQLLGQSSVVCFIDALDECDEPQVRELVAFLQHLGELTVLAGIRFQVCFSSRHYPHITISRGLSLVLEGQEGHIQDITSYIDSSLRIGHSKLAEQIRVEFQEKASGVFMWVVLVVDILNKEHDGGRMHEIRQRLRDIPGGLHELFRDILTRDCHRKNELLLCIQWLLFAKRPLKPEELYFAILSGIQPQILSRWDSDGITTDIIKRFILNSSKGLAEITKSKTPSVQFIHESVRDFLLKENGLSAVWSDLGSNFQGQSHERLKQDCLNYMSIDIATHLNIGAPLPRASSQEAIDLRQSVTKAFPFLEYAVHNVLYHADKAERDGVSQKDFISGFPLVDWIHLDNLFERHEIRRHSSNTSFLYILAENNMPHLIRVHPSNLSCFEVEDERHGLPIFAALATRSDEAVQALLEAQAEIQPLTSPLHDLCKEYCQDRNKRAIFRRNFTFSRQKGVLSCVEDLGDEILLAFLLHSANVDADSKDQLGRRMLHRAAEIGQEGVVKLLLAIETVDVDLKDQQGRTPLIQAIQNGHEGVVKLLLATEGVNANSKDQQGQTPLSWAIQNGQEGVIKLLLATGRVDANSKDQQGQTPLIWAIQNGQEGVVKLFLATTRFDADSKDQQGRMPLIQAVQNGHEGIVKLLLATKRVDANAQDDISRTPLFYAAVHGCVAVVQLLLEHKADANAKDMYNRTPLWYAVTNGHVAIVQLLLEHKVDADAKDMHNRTPLSYAAINGHKAVVQLLLEHKADADAKDMYNRTPLWFAAANGRKAVVQLLREHKADAGVDVTDKDGRTLLL